MDETASDDYDDYERMQCSFIVGKRKHTGETVIGISVALHLPLHDYYNDDDLGKHDCYE